MSHSLSTPVFGAKNSPQGSSTIFTPIHLRSSEIQTTVRGPQVSRLKLSKSKSSQLRRCGGGAPSPGPAAAADVRSLECRPPPPGVHRHRWPGLANFRDARPCPARGGRSARWHPRRRRVWADRPPHCRCLGEPCGQPTRPAAHRPGFPKRGRLFRGTFVVSGDSD